MPATVGVEEEFLIVHPRTREPVPLGAAVAEAVNSDDLDIQLELSPAQVESASGVCADLLQLREQLQLGRRRLAQAAEAAGGRLVAVGAPILGTPPDATSSPPRYRLIGERYGALAKGSGLCGCHVHVEVSSTEAAVQVSNFLRPWLPVLLALTANSPFFHGAETGYASWRSLLWSRWPLAGPPPYFESERHYRAMVDELIDCGVILDRAMIYWHVRPSEHVPTIEVRIADVAATVDDAVLLAGVVRALVATAVDAIGRGEPAPAVSHELVRAACWQAAREGPAGRGVDLLQGRPVPAWEMVDRLLAHVRPALRASGDDALVTAMVKQLRARGCGADQQREDYGRAGDILAVVDGVIERTVAGVN